MQKRNKPPITITIDKDLLDEINKYRIENYSMKKSAFFELAAKKLLKKNIK